MADEMGDMYKFAGLNLGNGFYGDSDLSDLVAMQNLLGQMGGMGGLGTAGAATGPTAGTGAGAAAGTGGAASTGSDVNSKFAQLVAMATGENPFDSYLGQT